MDLDCSQADFYFEYPVFVKGARIRNNRSFGLVGIARTTSLLRTKFGNVSIISVFLDLKAMFDSIDRAVQLDLPLTDQFSRENCFSFPNIVREKPTPSSSFWWPSTWFHFEKWCSSNLPHFIHSPQMLLFLGCILRFQSVECRYETESTWSRTLFFHGEQQDEVGRFRYLVSCISTGGRISDEVTLCILKAP